MKPSHYPSLIAIDGPSASGKSTLGKLLADKLGYTFFDTGVMYRAITWIAINKNPSALSSVLADDEAWVTRLAETCEMDIRPPSVADNRDCDILADGQDITWEIRRPDVEANVSMVSAFPGVRQALSAQQRRIGLRGKIVMVGRDIGTVVLPEAEVKLYLVASPEERARRRTEQLQQRGKPAVYQEILDAMRERDRIDSTRDISPAVPAPDAVILDTDRLTIQQMFRSAWQLIRQKRTTK